VAARAPPSPRASSLSPDRRVVAFGSTGTGGIIRVDLERWRLLKPARVVENPLPVEARGLFGVSAPRR
jgi:hypothetical protein